MNVLNDPTHGAEEAASAEPSEISGDAGALAALLDAVLEENRRLSEAVNSLDVERLAQANCDIIMPLRCRYDAVTRSCRDAVTAYRYSYASRARGLMI